MHPVNNSDIYTYVRGWVQWIQEVVLIYNAMWSTVCPDIIPCTWRIGQVVEPSCFITCRERALWTDLIGAVDKKVK